VQEGYEVLDKLHSVLLVLSSVLMNQPYILKADTCWVPVAHTYNPSFSGGRDQEGSGSKPGQANSLRPYSKKRITKKKKKKG
jgi:hypothetical protein